MTEPERSDAVSSMIFCPSYEYETVRSDRAFETRLQRASYEYSAIRRSGYVISVTVEPDSVLQGAVAPESVEPDEVAQDWVSVEPEEVSPVPVPVQEPVSPPVQDSVPLHVPVAPDGVSELPLPESAQVPGSVAPEEVPPLQVPWPVVPDCVSAPVPVSVDPDEVSVFPFADASAVPLPVSAGGASVHEEVPVSAGGVSEPEEVPVSAGGGSDGGIADPESVSDPSQISFRSVPLHTRTVRAFSVTRTSRFAQSYANRYRAVSTRLPLGSYEYASDPVPEVPALSAETYWSSWFA